MTMARVLVTARLPGEGPARLAAAGHEVTYRDLADPMPRDELLAAVAALPENDRQAIACRYLLDLSEEETAAALGCPRGTVKSRLSRALERLRERIEVPHD